MPTRFFLERKKREYRWFVEPIDGGHTNQVIAGLVCEENFYQDKLCEDGERRNLWEVPHRIVNQLERNSTARFHIFVQRGEGALRRWRFYPRTRRKVRNAQLKMRRA